MFSAQDKQTLLDLARASIQYGLDNGKALPVQIEDYPEHLQAQRACFVTLQINGQLRGCIGSLEAYRPLVIDVAENAFAAAFRDPRFTPLDASEYASLQYHISVLHPPEPMTFNSEENLIAQLRPGVDGLVLEDKGLRGTFLPSVWEDLSKPEEFFQHLKLKAGLPPYHWSDTIKVERYTVEDIE